MSGEHNDIRLFTDTVTNPYPGMIPTFLVVSKLGLVNSLWSLIVLSLLGAYNIVVLRSAFHAIPKSLIESAQLDGANDFLILGKIVVPLSKATLATIGLWSIAESIVNEQQGKIWCQGGDGTNTFCVQLSAET